MFLRFLKNNRNYLDQYGKQTDIQGLCKSVWARRLLVRLIQSSKESQLRSQGFKLWSRFIHNNGIFRDVQNHLTIILKHQWTIKKRGFRVEV